MTVTCRHCGARKPCLHWYIERAGIMGTFQVIRCLLCGWQLSRLIPPRLRWKGSGDQVDMLLENTATEE